MYLAELHGKLSPEMENMEDILTSNVFSLFKYAPREIFLKSLLKSLSLYPLDEELKKAAFNFWPTFDDNTEPDLVIIVGNYYLLFEAKYFSPFGKQKISIEGRKIEDQLLRELRVGTLEAQNRGLQFKMIAITSDYYYKPEKFKEIPDTYLQFNKNNDFQWINWQMITTMISEILECNNETDAMLFSQDLLSLLLKKNLRSYKGCKVFFVKKRLVPVKMVFFPIKKVDFPGFFGGFCNKLAFSKTIKPFSKQIFFSKVR